MAQKYPQDRQRFRSKIPNCCRSRVGTVKEAWPTEAEAMKVARKHNKPQETYPCRQGRGYHLRTKRNERRG